MTLTVGRHLLSDRSPSGSEDCVSTASWIYSVSILRSRSRRTTFNFVKNGSKAASARAYLKASRVGSTHESKKLEIEGNCEASKLSAGSPPYAAIFR
jgi:hypothetical protein